MTDSIPETDPIRWYGENAEQYAAQTEGLDMSSQRKLFLDLVPFPAPGRARRILDVGCGGGRDALAFRMEGLDVTGLEPCPQLAQIAMKYAGVAVFEDRVENFRTASMRFEGVWACASLVHLSVGECDKALRRIRDALAIGGIVYASFKRPAERPGEVAPFAVACRRQSQNSGMIYTDLTPAGLAASFRRADLELEALWCTRDARFEKDPVNYGWQWVNGLARRRA